MCSKVGNHRTRNGLSQGSLRCAFLCACFALAACSGEEPAGAERDGLALQLAGGTYSDGSGRLGIALAATLRDAQGRGPAEPWSGTLSDRRGALAPVFSYAADSQEGSYGAWWWPDVGVAAGETYDLTLSRASGEELTASFIAPDSPGLATPQVELSADGMRLTWAPVPTASGYACQVYANGHLQLSVSTDGTECDLAALPEGTYSAAVLAFSTSLEALRGDSAQRPVLPQAFHVSEGRLAFAKGQGPGATHRAIAAGGAFHYGRLQPGLALWVSITRADGTPFAESGQVELVGPGLRAETPLRFTYPAGVRQYLVWSYDAQALPGAYTLTARLSGQLLSTHFSIGELGALASPTDVRVTPLSSGGASVAWRPVAGARAYYVSAWDTAKGVLAAALWTTEASAMFGSLTFEAGRMYDVYVAATDVDVASVSSPARVTVSENTYFPMSFIAQ